MANRIADVTGKTLPHDPHAGNRAQAATRIVFIPWDPVEGVEWTAKAQNWYGVGMREKGKGFHIINYDPMNGGHWLLKQIGTQADSVIYLRGHGSPSSPTINTRLAGAGGATVESALPIEEACQRLIDMGLEPGYPGTIKFYFCYSGTIFQNLKQEIAGVKGTNKTRQQQNKIARKLAAQAGVAPQVLPMRALPVGKSLARQGADYMRKKGFTHCIYYGYLGPLASEYSDDPHDFDDPTTVQQGVTSHRSVGLDAQLVNRPIPAGQQGFVRASAGRIQV